MSRLPLLGVGFGSMCCFAHALPSAADGCSLGQGILSGIFESMVD